MSDIEYRLNNLENAVSSINDSIASLTQTIMLMIKDIEDIKKECRMNEEDNE